MLHLLNAYQKIVLADGRLIIMQKKWFVFLKSMVSGTSLDLALFGFAPNVQRKGAHKTQKSKRKNGIAPRTHNLNWCSTTNCCATSIDTKTHTALTIYSLIESNEHTFFILYCPDTFAGKSKTVRYSWINETDTFLLATASTDWTGIQELRSSLLFFFFT